MSRIGTMRFEYVELMPKVLADGVVYISLEHDVITHNCCCGCGERVVNSTGPAQWTATVQDGKLSIHPSIGTGAQACKSHYWIRNGKVRWAKPLTSSQTQASQLADRQDTIDHYAARLPSWRIIKRLKRRLARGA